jgi:hypothetical protein
VGDSSPFFRGSELPRLVILTGITLLGWALFWNFTQKRPAPIEAPLTVTGEPEPIVPDKAVEFESVTDRTPLSFRDNAAYAMLLERAREKSASELATAARRDVLLAHLWQDPGHYRGVPIHLLGAARRVLRYESKLSKTGWLYEAWIIEPDAALFPFVCVFEEPPPGFPIGGEISERVVFNGYFLKIMKYQAGDVPRGAPLLVGRIGWEPSTTDPVLANRHSLRWSLVVIIGMFAITMFRWLFQLRRLFVKAPPKPSITVSDQLDPESLQAWAQSLSAVDEHADEPDSWESGPAATDH